MVQWVYDAAVASGVFEAVVVATDSDDVAELRRGLRRRGRAHQPRSPDRHRPRRRDAARHPLGRRRGQRPGRPALRHRGDAHRARRAVPPWRPTGHDHARLPVRIRRPARRPELGEGDPRPERAGALLLAGRHPLLPQSRSGLRCTTTSASTGSTGVPRHVRRARAHAARAIARASSNCACSSTGTTSRSSWSTHPYSRSTRPTITPGPSSCWRGSARRDRGPSRVGPVTFGVAQPLALLAGPCVIESARHTPCDGQRRSATICDADRRRLRLQGQLRQGQPHLASSSYRGLAMDDGLAILARVRDEVGVPVVTDIHECEQAAPVAEVVDVLQIPAFLCRQTDLLVAAAADRAASVNVKKGQFLSPRRWRTSWPSSRSAATTASSLTERGTTFGYNNLVVDFRSLPQLRGARLPGDLRRHAQRAAARRPRRRAPAASASGCPTLARAAVAVGRRRHLHGDPRRSRPRAVGRTEHGAAGPARAAC